jgi:multiple sugar transport system permease protein
VSRATYPTTRARPRGRAIPARLVPLLWLGPAIALICFVVVWPTAIMVETSFQHISPDGFVQGWYGWRNFGFLWGEPDLPGILIRTAVWVFFIVSFTMLISLATAQLFNEKFPGRRFARWALIAPWAASVVMTSIVFRWAFDANNGVFNVFLNNIGLLKGFNSDASDWLGNPVTAFACMIAVAIFVSIPFTTYALLAGLQSIPGDIYEAARIDGAGAWKRYLYITLPLLRPAFVVALLINVINDFNSFPIIWEMTRGGPGRETGTTTVFMYQLKQSYIGESAAMSVINFGIIIVVVAVYLRATLRKANPL